MLNYLCRDGSGCIKTAPLICTTAGFHHHQEDIAVYKPALELRSQYQALARAGRREPQTQGDGSRSEPGEPGDQGSPEFKALTPDVKRWAAVQLQQQGLSQRAACRTVALSRSVFAYKRRRRPTRRSLRRCRNWRSAFGIGFGKYFKLIRHRGHSWNHKQVYRVYCALGLNRRRIGKKRLPPRQPTPLCQRK